MAVISNLTQDLRYVKARTVRSLNFNSDKHASNIFLFFMIFGIMAVSIPVFCIVQFSPFLFAFAHLFPIILIGAFYIYKSVFYNDRKKYYSLQNKPSVGIFTWKKAIMANDFNLVEKKEKDKAKKMKK